MEIPFLPESPRLRRRLAWLAGFLGLAGLAAAAVVTLPVGHPLTGGPSNQPADVYREPKPARMTPARRAALTDTIDHFVEAAVLRRNPAEAWRLASPQMRAGQTEKEWARGELPVQPYSSDRFALADWQPVYSYVNLVGADVRVMPKEGAGGYIQVYSVELVADRRHGRTEWLVDSWYPAKVVPAIDATVRRAAAKKRKEASSRRGRQVAAPKPYEEPKGRLGAVWLLVPAAIFALLLAIPLGFAVREWLRGRAARTL
jgi:hypothetical protein